jgi:hypothetical protein
MNAREDSEIRDLTMDELHQVSGGTAADAFVQCVVYEAQNLANWISAGCVGPSPVTPGGCAQQKGSGGLKPL